VDASLTGGYTIRAFETIEEFQECVELQEDTWGHGFSERVAPAILKVSQILGGIAAGAYSEAGDLDGFVFGMTGLREGEIVHWSDMLAVRGPARDRGLGTCLKAYQREQVLPLGVEKMHWTFDPLQSRNAYLNFAKLGIVVREYAEDMYGQTDSPLHRGIGTDRFIALWLLMSHRVVYRLSGAAPPHAPPERAVSVLGASGEGALPRPGEPDVSRGNDELLVTIPSDIAAIMDDSMDLALEWRRATRTVFVHYLAAGYEVKEIFRGERTSQYMLVQTDDE
jgi:predicted GNAT superfamily acetyltransferase